MQVLRDMEPLTRPTRGWFNTDGLPRGIRLFLGAAAREDTGEIRVELKDAVRVTQSWFLLKVELYIDNLKVSDARPIYVFFGATSEWSGIAYFPALAPSGTRFGGLHSVAIRCYAEARS